MPRELEICQKMTSWIGKSFIWCPVSPSQTSTFSWWAESPPGQGAPEIPPPPVSEKAKITLSCFEIVLLAAAHVGVPRSIFQSMYAKTKGVISTEWCRAWLYNLSGGNPRDLIELENNRLLLPRGNIVFFQLNRPANGAKLFHHVALSTGTLTANGGDNEIISFAGKTPNEPASVVLTSIGQITRPGSKDICDPGELGGGTVNVYYSEVNVPG